MPPGPHWEILGSCSISRLSLSLYLSFYRLFLTESFTQLPRTGLLLLILFPSSPEWLG